MGIDQGTMNLLLKGRTEVELTLRRLKETTAVTKAQGEESEKLNEKIIASRQAFAAFGRALVFDASPALEKIIQLFSDLGDWLAQHKAFVEGALTAIGVALGALGVALIPINMTVIAIGALGAALGVGLIGMKASEAVGRNPGAATPILVQAILSTAFAEGIVFFAIYLVR